MHKYHSHKLLFLFLNFSLSSSLYLTLADSYTHHRVVVVVVVGFLVSLPFPFLPITRPLIRMHLLSALFSHPFHPTITTTLAEAHQSFHLRTHPFNLSFSFPLSLTKVNSLNKLNHYQFLPTIFAFRPIDTRGTHIC